MNKCSFKFVRHFFLEIMLQHVASSVTGKVFSHVSQTYQKTEITYENTTKSDYKTLIMNGTGH